MDKDRNLLFGILAVQLKGVSPGQMVELGAAWVTDPKIPLAQRLVNQGLLKDQEREFLDRLVDEAIRAHGGDTAETLKSFGGEEQVRKTFYSTAESADLDAMKTAPMTGVAFFSRTGKEISGVEETPGRYTMISHHAKGGMGRVLLVRDEYLGRNVALKELMPPGAASGTTEKTSPDIRTSSMVARFLQEARVTGQLEHPAIVPVYELGRRQDNSLYYTMKFVRGKTLGQALRDCRNLRDRLQLLDGFVDLCQAIAYAHTRGVVHRDIKPGNVMIGQFGETVILDWGLAKVHDTEDANIEDIEDTLHYLKLDDEDSLHKTAYGRALGTPHYMPPEQAEGRIDDIDERSDVYSLGAVLYEILTGTTPYKGKHTREVLDQVKSSPPRPVLEMASDAPPELAGICEKALQRNRSDRYQSAVELADDVRRFVTGSLVGAYHYSFKELVRRYYRKHQLMINTVAAFLVLLLAGGIYSYVNILNARNREREQRLVAEENTYLSQIHAAQAQISQGDYVQANQALSETRPERRGWEWGYLRNQANPEMYTVEAPGTQIHGAFFTPDGTKILTLSKPEFATVWDAATGRPLVSLEGETAYYTSCAFTPDGSRVAVSALEGVGVWDLTSGKSVFHSPPSMRVLSVVFDKTGSRLFTGCGDKAIRVWDVSSGQLVQEIATEVGPVYSLKLDAGERRLLAGTGGAGMTSRAQAWSLPDLRPLLNVPGFFPCLSPDGAQVAAAEPPEIALYSLDTGVPLHWLKTQQDSIGNLRFSQDGARLVSAGANGPLGTVELWDTQQGERLRVLQCQEESVFTAFFIQNDRFVLTCTRNNRLALWPIDADAPLYTVRARGPGLWAADLASDGRRLAIAGVDQFFQVWDVLAPAGTWPGVYHEVMPEQRNTTGAYASSVVFSGTKQRFGVMWADKTCCVFDTGSMTQLFHSLGPTPFGGGTIALNSDGSRLVTGPDSFTPVVWDVATGSIVCVYREHDGEVGPFAWSPDGSRIASGSWDGPVHIWDAESGKTEQLLEGHLDGVKGIQFSRDGKMVLSGSLDKTAVLWDVATGQKVTVFQHAFPLQSVAFSERGDRIATVTSDQKIHVWDRSQGTEIGAFDVSGYINYVDPYEVQSSVAFALHDQCLVTRGHFTRTKLWDARSYALLAEFGESEFVELLDNRTAVAVTHAGAIRRIEADHPWKDGQGTKPETALLDHAREIASIRRCPDLPRFFVPLGTEVLTGALKALLDAVRGADADASLSDKGLRVTSGAPFLWTFRLGLLVGDCITQADGKALTSRADVLEWLEPAFRASSESTDSRLSLAVLRGGQTLQFEYRTVPMDRRKVSIALSSDAAILLIDRELAMIPASEQICRGAPPGIAYVAACLGSIAKREHFKAAGLCITDVILEFDGKHFSEFEPIRQYLTELRQRIQKGETVTFTHHVLHGMLTELDITYTVNPGAGSA